IRETVPVPEGADEVAYTFLAVRQSLTYTVRGGDYTTPVYRIDVPAQVRLSLVRATLHHPDYTCRPATTGGRAGGALEALRGSRAELTFVLDHPIAEAVLFVERLPRTGVRDQRTVTQKMDLTALAPTEFRGELAFEDAVGYELEVRQDGRGPERLGPF